MGMIECPRHQLSFLAIVCPHVEEAVRRLPGPIAWKAVRDPDGLRWATVCPECYLRVPDAQDMDFDEWYEAFEELWAEGYVPLCGRCLNEHSPTEPDRGSNKDPRSPAGG
jgi:hypothetical protein